MARVLPRGRHFVQLLLAILFVLLSALGLQRTLLAGPADGPGGPILVITSSTAPFSTYYAEILRTEGFNAFAVADLSTLSATTLAAYDVVLLPKMALNSTQVGVLSNWVNGGGNLVAMAPDPQLAPLLGLTPLGTQLAEGYLKIDTSRSPGNGLAPETLQFHGKADRYTLSGASALATLFSDAVTPTAHPAVSLRNVGSGHAAAFTYDLATSVVYTRQGNPLWAAQERDGLTPVRSNDKFYGPSTADPQADWVAAGRIAIPQADEQQRLLANLILMMNQARKPLPRFWYFPSGHKAVVIMTGDDHGNNGTAGRFDQFRAASPAGCSVADWQCIRGTSYLYPSTPLSDAQAAAFNAEGFEVGIHVSTGCADYSASSLQALYVQQLAEWSVRFPSLPAPVTERHHCVVWSDWVSGAQVELANGIRLDTSFYHWPPSWVNNTPGVFTGSAMPMRFATLDGNLVDVYQAATQMTDESGQLYPYTVDTLLDRAIGPLGYFGAYTVNAHTDTAVSDVANAVVASAQARGVPVITARQMLQWLDARNASSFSAFNWNGSALAFNINVAAGARNLQAHLPLRSSGRTLTALQRGTTAVNFSVTTIKGVDYAVFAAVGGGYVASYATDTAAPTVTTVTPAAGSTSASAPSAVKAVFSEAMDPASLTTATFTLRDAANVAVSASVSYDPLTRTASLVPASPLAGGVTYTARLQGGATEPRIKDLAGNPLATQSWSFTVSGNGPACPCSGWPATATPLTASFPDGGPIELGVRFRADVNGLVTGVRFYKGAGNTGTHRGSLWTAAGQLLASATFSAETATGWQEVSFATPVPITANTVYVASYFAPNGGYAVDTGFFANKGVDSPPIHLLQDGVSGANGLYAYTSVSAFPTSSYRSNNYWVDVVFTTGGVADTTPPAVTAVSPSAAASGVSASTAVSATFSEAMDPATVSGQTLELRTSAGALVAATVAYNSSTRVATLSPASALAAGTTYTATVRGGSADPRVKDLAGNALAANVSWSFTTAATGPCMAPANAIVAENCLAGQPASQWDISGAGDPSIQGFATQISVNRGTTVSFKVNTSASAYRFDIYRLGYYGGAGARLVATVQPSATLPQVQPACLSDSTTGLVDCGNWAVSGSWNVPATAVSGIYLARLVRADTGGASHIVFIVRNDASTSDLLFQTSDTTWQAYNEWGGVSLYTGGPVGRAYKVSYNRPLSTRGQSGGQDALFNAEYPMLRWLEANGYDVSYVSGVDTDRAGTLLRNHRVFLSVGHDEYWSGAQRANVEAARDAGVNLAFFSANEIFWKTRWEASIDGSGTPYRTLVCYKETHANARIDPADLASGIWTGTWRDARFSPPADGGRPENALSGTLFMVNDGATTAMTVPAADGKLRLWRNTSVATLAAGTVATLPNGTLGYEWDVDADNAVRPPGLMRLSSTTVSGAPVLQDNGSTYASGTATHSLTLYRAASGARVFGAGTVQWSWGLDATHDRAGTPSDVRIQQATVNLLADMNVQPRTLQAGLVAASASTDAVAPTSRITSPAAGASVAVGTAVKITGTATDSGGGVVGGVEVSVDGGLTWRRADGRESWSLTWTPAASGTATLRVRAVDDSGNLESPGAGMAVTVGSSTATCPCSLWPATAVPGNASAADTASVNLGVRFTSQQAGFITGIRFYKGGTNTGTHVGSLWSASGQLLASATFTGETASGWQQVNFAAPVAIAANTPYVASYLAPRGRYAADSGAFATSPVVNGPLSAPASTTTAGNGLYRYGTSNAFPNATYQATNYWVDVVFRP